MSYQNCSHFSIKIKGNVFALILLLAGVSMLFSGTTTPIHAQEAQTATSTTADTTDVAPATDESTPLPEEHATSTGETQMIADGTDTGESTTTDEHVGDVVEVSTGDADAHTEVENTENTNDTTATSTATTTVENVNTATSTTVASTTASTGNNHASGKKTSVTTGDATASTRVVNVVNTNIFNSTGLLYFLNMLMGNISLDTRGIFSVLTGQSTPTYNCADGAACEAINPTFLSNQNTATVTNDVAVVAQTGGNTTTATQGDSSMQTGDAYASADVVNIVNTNITDTNYLLLTVNNFQADSGNIIFPGARWFNQLFTQNMSFAPYTTLETNNTNDATVVNTGVVEANSGGNTATGTNATITTGDASAGVTVVNKVNTNMLGNSLSFLFRVHGSWAGKVFGLPEGMSWRRTDAGVEIYFDDATVEQTPTTVHTHATNTNTAVVRNNVSVLALTGENEARAKGSSTIATGDAMASANIVNVVNTNILGRNWVLAIFNIFGDWTGNISFGQPDLWVGARAIAPPTLHAGSCFDYEVTVRNFGDADAHNVMLTGVYDTLQQKIERMEQDVQGAMRHTIGLVSAGDTRTITLPVCLTRTVNPGTDVNTEFEVSADEDDADESNNSDVIGVTTVAGTGGGVALRLGPAKLSIEKTASIDTITASSTVTYEIIIKNTGDPVYNAMLIDTIYNSDGTPMYEQRWALDTIRRHETIIVSYDAFFNASTSPGTYANEAYISGTERHPDYKHSLGNPVDSPVASVNIEVVEREEDVPQQNTCTPLLTTYLRYGGHNSPREVGALQFFLKTIEGFENITITNEFDEETYRAVRTFQERYAHDVLDPWGMQSPSGFVYYTTQKKINEIWCKDMDFPLTESQRAEIEAFRKQSRNFIERYIDTPQQDATDTDPLPLYGMREEEVDEQTSIALANTAQEEEMNQATEVAPQVAQVASLHNNTFLDSLWDTIRTRISHALAWVSLW